MDVLHNGGAAGTKAGSDHCGACTQVCPQNIDVPGVMADFTEKLRKLAEAKE